MNKKFIVGILVGMFFLIYSVGCQSNQTSIIVLTPTFTTTPTYLPSVALTNTVYISPTPTLIGTPISKEIIPFDLDGFEHLPVSSAGTLINLSKNRLTLLSKKIDSMIGLSDFYSSLPLVEYTYSLNSADDGKELFLAGYQYKGDARSDMGILLFDSNDNIVYYSQPEIYAVQVRYRIVPVRLSETTKGVFLTIFTSTGGSGIDPTIYRKLFVLKNEKPNLVWHWNNDAGRQCGIFDQDWDTVYTDFEDLSDSPMLDITLEKQSRTISDNTSFWEYYPGKLVFSWKNNRYELSYFYDGINLHPIHSNKTVVMAPGGSWGKLLEQIDDKWFFFDRLGYDITWNKDNIYFHFRARPDNVLQVALDTDLSGDFESSAINSDDYVFELNIPKVEKDTSCKNIVVKPISSSATKINVTVSSHGDYIDCGIVLVMPRKDLFHAELVESPSVIYSYLGEFNIPIKEYHRNYVNLMGIAIQPKKFSDRYKFDMNNPVTWGTLIFISNQ